MPHPATRSVPSSAAGSPAVLLDPPVCPESVPDGAPDGPPERAPSPAVLVERCTRDPASSAWSTLVERYDGHLRRGVHRAFRRVGQSPTPDRVDDLVQEAYCRLLEDRGRRLRTFRGTVPAELGAWLRRIAERTAIDHLRAAAADKRGRDLLVPASVLAESSPDPRSSPAQRVEQREQLRHFVRRCRALAPGEKDARILALVLLGGWTSRDVARATGGAYSPSRVDTLVHRLRRRLAAEGLRLADRSGRLAGRSTGRRQRRRRRRDRRSGSSAAPVRSTRIPAS